MFGSKTPKMEQITFDTVGISIAVPEKWKATPNPTFKLLIMAPSDADYQSNLGINFNQAQGAEPEAMDQFLEELRQKEEQQRTKYQQTSYEKLEIGGAPARLRHYEWVHDKSRMYFSQVQCLILPNPNLLYVIDGSSLKELEEKYIPILDSMIRSIRFTNR